MGWASESRTGRLRRPALIQVRNEAAQAVLQAYNVLGLQAFWALLNFEFDCLSFVKALVPIGLDSREVHEDVLTGLALDEPVALRCVEPLDCTLLFAHRLLLLDC
jgi:hypothetical protein